MNELLLEKKVTGATLFEYNTLIRIWVLKQIRNIEHPQGLTEEDVQTIVDKTLENFQAGVDEEKVKEIVNEILSEFDISGGSGEGEFLPVIKDETITTITQFMDACGISYDNPWALNNRSIILDGVTMVVEGDDILDHPNTDAIRRAVYYIRVDVSNGNTSPSTLYLYDGAQTVYIATFAPLAYISQSPELIMPADGVYTKSLWDMVGGSDESGSSEFKIPSVYGTFRNLHELEEAIGGDLEDVVFIDFSDGSSIEYNGPNGVEYEDVFGLASLSTEWVSDAIGDKYTLTFPNSKTISFTQPSPEYGFSGFTKVEFGSGGDGATWPNDVPIVPSDRSFKSIDEINEYFWPDLDPSDKTSHYRNVWAPEKLHITYKTSNMTTDTVDYAIPVGGLMELSVVMTNTSTMTIAWLRVTTSTNDLYCFYSTNGGDATFLHTPTNESYRKLFSNLQTKTMVQTMIDNALASFEGGGGDVDVPEWVSDVIYIKDTAPPGNLTQLFATLWPDETASTDPRTATIWVGETGWGVLYVAPGTATLSSVSLTPKTFYAVSIDSDGVTFADLAGNQLRFTISGQHLTGTFVYDADKYNHHISASDLVTKKMVQDMIDESIGAALSDSY